MNNRRPAAKAAVFLLFFFWAVTCVNGSHAGTDMQKDQTTYKNRYGRIEGDITLSQETIQRLLLSQNIGSNLLRFQEGFT